MPVPIVMPTTLRPPRAAPRHHSPSVAQFASLSSVAGRSDAARRSVAQREILPAEIRRDDHDARFAIERPGRADADAEEIARAPRRSPPCVSAITSSIMPRDPIDDGVGAAIGERRDRSHRDLAAAVLRHRAGDDVRAAEVDADDVTAPSTRHTGTGGLRTSREQASTTSVRRQLAHAAPMAERTPLRAVTIARPAGQAVVPRDRDVARRADRSRIRAPSVRRSPPSAFPSPMRDAAAPSRSSLSPRPADQLRRCEEGKRSDGVHQTV